MKFDVIFDSAMMLSHINKVSQFAVNQLRNMTTSKDSHTSDALEKIVMHS